MMRFFLDLQYDGTAYHGWQIQPNGTTVEEVIEKALSTLLRQTVDIVGAGRTDAGVHARRMTAHFDIEKDSPAAGCILPADSFIYKLNRMLPRDIVILGIREVPEDMHARFSALSRTYHYYIHTQKDPFRDRYSCLITYPLDFALMNEAAGILMEHTDFGAFCKANSDVKTTLCHVTEARWIQTGSHDWYFRITANRFLRNMVRAIVGTLIDVGRGRISLSGMRSITEGGCRSDAGESMPAKALFLEDIEYPGIPLLPVHR